jgi:aminoglycoside phosphotransferase
MLDDEIIRIFKNKLSEEVILITDCSAGIEQIVKIVKTKQSKYVIKIPLKGNEAMVFREIFACEKMLGEKNIPGIFSRGRNYLIESFIEGKMLSKARLASEDKKNVYVSLGKVVRKIHNIKMWGVGELRRNLRGEHQTLDCHIEFLLRKNVPLLRKTGLLSEEEIVGIRNYLIMRLNKINRQESVLLHFDLTDSNVLVSGSTFSGLIDFGDLSCGPRAYDIAKLYIEKKGSEDFTNFLKGYGQADLGEIEYFTVCHLLYEIPYYHSVSNDRRCAKLLKMLDDIVSKRVI